MDFGNRKIIDFVFFLKCRIATKENGTFIGDMSFWNVGNRTLLRIDGTDAVRYLNGQITQDAQLAIRNRDRAFATCVTDAKGKLQAYGSIFSWDGKSVFLEAPLELREILLARIERYLIADDAEIVDVSDDYHLRHVLSIEGNQENPGGMVLRFDRLGVPGMDHWSPVAAPVTEDGISWDDAERIRIRQGVPRWGAELEEGLLPSEAGLEACAISYGKGCYIGQEVISRMKTAGKVNRCLGRFFLADEADQSKNLVGAELLMGETVVGQIRSHAEAHAMGWIKKIAFEEAALLTSCGVKLTRVK
jgi:folate-binding protein YgfZ